jgi:mitochondrial import receptor subunit TOM40
MALIEEKGSPLSFLSENVVAATVLEAYSNLSEKRKALGLENPGTVDNISREVQREVLLSNYMFSGLRCDLQKIFSVAPLFRLQHGFAMGSQALPPWQLMALYGTPRVRTAVYPIRPQNVANFFARFSCREPSLAINPSQLGAT